MGLDGHWLRAEGRSLELTRGRAVRPRLRVIAVASALAGSGRIRIPAADEADSVRLFAISEHPRGGSSPVPRHWCSAPPDCPCPADQENLVRGNAVLVRQVLNDGIGAALAELIVVIGRAGGIGVALDLDDVVLLALNLLRRNRPASACPCGSAALCQSAN